MFTRYHLDRRFFRFIGGAELDCNGDKDYGKGTSGTSVCLLLNGNIQYKSANSLLQKLQSGPVYCPSERLANARNTRARAEWTLLQTCSNGRGRDRDITCDYTRKVGISRSSARSAVSSSSSGSGFSEEIGFASEFSAMFGAEVGDPFGTLKLKLDASATFGFSWKGQSSSSATFTQSVQSRNTAGSTTSSSYGASFKVSPGTTSSVCQPVGYVDDFVVHANRFKVVDGDRC